MNSRLQIGLTLSLEENAPKMKENLILHVFQIEASTHALRSISSFTRYMISVFLIISVSVGTLFKFVLYRYVLISSKENNGSYFKMTPINSMIFTSAVIHHLVHVYVGFFLVSSIGMDIILEKILGEEFCYISLFIGKESYHSICEIIRKINHYQSKSNTLANNNYLFN